MRQHDLSGCHVKKLLQGTRVKIKVPIKTSVSVEN